MSSKILQSWSSLEGREKLTIVIGVALVLLTACYLLFSGLWAERSALAQEKNRLMTESEWMQEQVELSEQLVNSCRDNQILALESSALLELVASRNQISLASVVENFTNNQESFSVSIEANDGNNILRFIHQSACQGFALAQVHIEQSEAEDFYFGQVEFNHEG